VSGRFLSICRLFEGHHRVLRSHPVTGSRTTASALLAYVLVHEITHVVQGVNRHSQTGVMKAHWSTEDQTAILERRLGFEEHDVQLMRQGLAAAGVAVQRVSWAGPNQESLSIRSDDEGVSAERVGRTRKSDVGVLRRTAIPSASTFCAIMCPGHEVDLSAVGPQWPSEIPASRLAIRQTVRGSPGA